MGRPRKQREEGDDGKSHRIWDITDWALYDEYNQVIPERLAMWEHMSREDSCKKLMVAGEEAPESKRWHGQCRISFPCPHRFDYVKKLFGQHCESTIAKDDWSYFKKFGSEKLIDVDYRVQGRRNAFAEQKELIREGANIRDCLDVVGANWQTIRNGEMLMKYIEKPREESERYVHLVRDNAQVMPPDVYHLTSWNDWFGYDGHKDLYIDQLLCKLTLHQLKRCVGSGPFRIARGMRQAKWDHVYISGLDDNERRALRLDRTGRFTHDDYINMFRR